MPLLPVSIPACLSQRRPQLVAQVKRYAPYTYG